MHVCIIALNCVVVVQKKIQVSYEEFFAQKNKKPPPNT